MFDVDALQEPTQAEERRLLEEAYFAPYSGDAQATYDRFRQTVSWALDYLRNGEASSAEVIARHYADHATAPTPLSSAVRYLGRRSTPLAGLPPEVYRWCVVGR